MLKDKNTDVCVMFHGNEHTSKNSHDKLTVLEYFYLLFRKKCNRFNNHLLEIISKLMTDHLSCSKYVHDTSTFKDYNERRSSCAISFNNSHL